MEATRQAKHGAAIFLVVAGSILWIPLIQLLAGRPPDFLHDLGFLSGPSGTPLSWILALVVAFTYVAYSLRNPLVARYWLKPSLLKALGVVTAVGAAVVEEAFFRRLIMDWVMDSGGGPLVQVIASALIFGGAHGIWGIVTGRMAVGISVMIVTGVLGAALAAVYLVGGRSLAPVIVSHFLITASIQPGILFAAFTGRLRLPVMSG